MEVCLPARPKSLIRAASAVVSIPPIFGGRVGLRTVQIQFDMVEQPEARNHQVPSSMKR